MVFGPLTRFHVSRCCQQSPHRGLHPVGGLALAVDFTPWGAWSSAVDFTPWGAWFWLWTSPRGRGCIH